MKIELALATSRSIIIEVEDVEAYYYIDDYELYLNGEKRVVSNKVVESIYGLKPDQQYSIYIKRGEEISNTLEINTPSEFVTLNVRDFGAKGDGSSDDTLFLQAAIMSCPKNSRVYIPKGVYKFTNLFLKSDMVLELGNGAVLQADTDKAKIPVLPGRIESYDEETEYLLGSWEGNPLDSFASLITGIRVENVLICGEGTMDGGADFENWWTNSKDKNNPARPRMIFLNRCKNITIQGITITNSPAWNVHPYFSDQLRFIDLKILSPSKSHNTDGLDPESCKQVEILGVYFSVGDDCIAIKSGKIYMGKKYKTPSRDITIRHCYMNKGHGAVTIGSEIAGGVKNIKVENCLFSHTDRGLRIKTRRGRGEDSILEDISFEHIKMDNVKTPFVVNSFYYCDPDGKTEYVACKLPLPIDERTPSVKSLYFKDIECVETHVAGCYFYGLPEKKIKRIEMENIYIEYAKEALVGRAAMMTGCEKASKQGIFVRNVENLIMKNVELVGNEGKVFDIDMVDQIMKN